MRRQNLFSQTFSSAVLLHKAQHTHEMSVDVQQFLDERRFILPRGFLGSEVWVNIDDDDDDDDT